MIQCKSVFLILLLKILAVSCKREGSLTFVIDNTGSMESTINQVKRAIDGIMDIILNNPASQIMDVVLTTFNDPYYESYPCNASYPRTVELWAKTRDRLLLKSKLASIYTHSGWCLECALTGVQMAIENSLPNSYMFVFSNTGPRDGDLTKKTIRMAQNKNIQIFFILTDDGPCPIGNEYYEIAKATYGQVLLCNVNEMDKILRITETLIGGDGNVINQVQVPAREYTYVPFTVDDQTEYVVVLASGTNVELDITEGPTRKYIWTTQTTYVKALRINNPPAGLYKARVYGNTTTSVLIFGRTDFTFQHGFSETEPPTFRDNIKQPTVGRKYHLLVSVNDPGNATVIETAQIQSSDKSFTKEFPLKKKSHNYYVTDAFLSPHDLFYIAVKGKGVYSGKEVIRRSKTPIAPRLPGNDPIITIQHSGSLEYNSQLVLTCNVRANPNLKITWRDGSGAKLHAPVSRRSFLDFVSTTKIRKLRKSQIYHCFAESEHGDAEETVNIKVKSPFNVINTERDLTVEYGETATFTCNIKSRHAMAITWHHQNLNKRLEIITNSKNYEISNDGTQLKINHVKDVEEGTYMCTAWIMDDHETNVTIHKQLYIKHVAPQMENAEDLEVLENTAVVLKCKILKGYPNPKIVWQFKRLGSNDFQVIPQTVDELKIERPELKNSGEYKCTAENTKGKNARVINLNVLEIPKIEKSRSVVKVARYDIAELNCKILKGNPKPMITWSVLKDGVKQYDSLSKISGEKLRINRSNYDDIGKYRCEARNRVGSDMKDIELYVQGAPKILSNSDKTHTAILGDPFIEIPCIVEGWPSPSITWMKNSTSVLSDGRIMIQQKKDPMRPHRTTGSLVIKNPVEADSMDYTCTATNELGNDTKVFDLFVTDSLESEEDFGNITNVYLLQGESRQFNCTNGRWFKEGLLMEFIMDTLSIYNAKISDDDQKDDGNYTCRTHTKEGSKSHTYVIDVGYPPKLVRQEKETHNWKGYKQNLDCNVEMKPNERTVEIKWLYNGKISDIEDELHPIVGWGNYSCEISNVHGRVQKQHVVYSTSCLIKKKSIKSPVLLDASGKWPKLRSSGDYFTVPNSRKMMFSCHNQPDNENFFKTFPDKSEIEVKCDHEDKFTVDDKVYKYSDFQCNADVIPKVQETGNKCAFENTKMFEVGYNVNFTSKFVKLYEICFDETKKVPVYAKVTVDYSGNSEAINRPVWKKFDKLSNSPLHDCDDSSKCCLGTTQLVKPLDMRSGPAESATFIQGLNTVPVYHNCGHNVTWNEVDASIRTKIDRDMNMWSGAHEYTDKNGTAVPRYLWKVLKPTKFSSIIVVQVNDPSPVPKDILCPQKCPDGTPSSTILQDNCLPNDPCPVGIGHDLYTYCCSIEDFQNNFKIPIV